MTKIGALTYANLLHAMLPGDLNCRELAEETGLHYITVLDYTRAMHKKGVIHIARYDPDSRGRHITIIYKLGPGKDAKRVRLTDVQRTQRYRDKKAAMQMIQRTAGTPIKRARADKLKGSEVTDENRS